MSDDCRDVVRRLHEYLDGECGEDLEATIRAHLADCPPCWDRADFEMEVRRVVASQCREKAPAALVQRVLAELRLEDPGRTGGESGS
jgi:anti-sigma factor (TIGR02949 family)